jgi:hypothetical protein
VGQASKRGTFEQRKANALQREQDWLAEIELDRQLVYQRHVDAYKQMVWWQRDMSEERHAVIMRAKMRSHLAWAGLMGMIHGMGWNSFSHMYR